MIRGYNICDGAPAVIFSSHIIRESCTHFLRTNKIFPQPFASIHVSCYYKPACDQPFAVAVGIADMRVEINRFYRSFLLPNPIPLHEISDSSVATATFTNHVFDSTTVSHYMCNGDFDRELS